MTNQKIKLSGRYKDLMSLSQMKGDVNLLKRGEKYIKLANQRFNRLRKEEVVSTAARSVEARRNTDKYSVFSSKGLSSLQKMVGNDKNGLAGVANAKGDFAMMDIIDTIMDSIKFLNNPTSTVSGAKKYVNRVAEKFGVDYDLANEIVYNATSPEINEDGEVAIWNYQNNIEDMKQEGIDGFTSSDVLGTSKETFNVVNEDDFFDSSDFDFKFFGK